MVLAEGIASALSSSGFLVLAASLIAFVAVYIFRSHLLGALDYVVPRLRYKSDYFLNGYGDMEKFEWLAANFADFSHMRAIDNVDVIWEDRGDYFLGKGQCISPAAKFLPMECQVLHMEFVFPPQSNIKSLVHRPIAVLLAATGEEGFDSRRPLARNLLNHGITSVVIEIPFYGLRRMEGQTSSSLLYVQNAAEQSLGACWEAVGIVNYLRSHCEFKGPICFAGMSYGAVCASFAALVAPYDAAVVSCVPAHSMSAPFLEGVLRDCINWGNFEHDKTRLQHALSRVTSADVLKAAHAVGLQSKKLYYHQLTGKHDLFIPHYSAMELLEDMKKYKHSVEVKFELLDGGHVAAFTIHRSKFVSSIVAAIERISHESFGKEV